MASTHHQEEHWNRMGAKPKRRSAVKPVQGDRRRGKREESRHSSELASSEINFSFPLSQLNPW